MEQQAGTTTSTATTVHRVERLAEMVVALSGCHPEAARNAVRRSLDDDTAEGTGEVLAIVATAMVSVRRGIDLRDA